MLPIEKLTVRYFDDAKANTVGWSNDYAGQTFFIGKHDLGTFATSFGDDETWTSETIGVHSYGSFIDDFHFRVDPRSFIRLEHLDNPIGSLLIYKNEIRLCVPSPTRRGHLKVIVAEGPFDGPDNFAPAFAKWQAVTMLDGQPHVLFERK